MNKSMIEVSNYIKKYGDFTAVDSISFSVDEGEIFGFVGPNGAGKSTTINTLCTILPKTSGSLLINGHDVSLEPDQVRSDIGVVFQDMTLDRKMSVEETLKMHCELYNVPRNEIKGRIDFALDLAGLTEFKRATCGSLSGGMKRRVEIARGILHTPKVLFLDEPTTGLDPLSRKNIWEYILRLQREQNITIFLTTHYMEEADVCSHMAIMQGGKITAMDTPEKLKQEYTRSLLYITCSDEETVMAQLKDTGFICEKKGNRLEISTDSEKTAIAILDQVKDRITDFEFKHGTLNDVFLGVTSGQELKGDLGL